MSSLRTMVNLVLPLVEIFSSEKPMQVTVISALLLISREKFPSKSVTAPLVVPVSITVAPITGCPVSSTTLPVIVFLCCSIAENPSDFTFSALAGGSAHIRNKDRATSWRKIPLVPVSRYVWVCLVFFIIRKVDKVWLFMWLYYIVSSRAALFRVDFQRPCRTAPSAEEHSCLP